MLCTCLHIQQTGAHQKMAAGFFNRLFTPRSGPAPSSEDVYQKIIDNQPQNIYREVSLLNGHTAPVNHLVRVNGSRFVTCSEDRQVIVWDSEHGHRLHILEGHSSPVTSALSISSDTHSGRRSSISDSIILTGSQSELIMWEISNDERLDPGSTRKIITEHNGPIHCLVALRHNMICSGGRDLCLWDVPSGRLLFKYDRSQLLGHIGVKHPFTLKTPALCQPGMVWSGQWPISVQLLQYYFHD